MKNLTGNEKEVNGFTQFRIVRLETGGPYMCRNLPKGNEYFFCPRHAIVMCS